MSDLLKNDENKATTEQKDHKDEKPKKPDRDFLWRMNADERDEPSSPRWQSFWFTLLFIMLVVVVMISAFFGSKTLIDTGLKALAIVSGLILGLQGAAQAQKALSAFGHKPATPAPPSLLSGSGPVVPPSLLSSSPTTTEAPSSPLTLPSSPPPSLLVEQEPVPLSVEEERIRAKQERIKRLRGVFGEQEDIERLRKKAGERTSKLSPPPCGSLDEKLSKQGQALIEKKIASVVNIRLGDDGVFGLNAPVIYLLRLRFLLLTDRAPTYKELQETLCFEPFTKSSFRIYANVKMPNFYHPLLDLSRKKEEKDDDKP